MHEWFGSRTIVAVSTVLTAGVKMLSEIKNNLKQPNQHWLLTLKEYYYLLTG